MARRLIILFTVLAIASCNRPADYALVGSAYVPAAHGEIDVESIGDGQFLISMTLDYLVPPEKIELGLTHYLVWFVPVGEAPRLQRALDYDPQTLTGRASIPTPLREFEVQVTAENRENPNQPSDLIVASQKIREN